MILSDLEEHIYIWFQLNGDITILFVDLKTKSVHLSYKLFTFLTSRSPFLQAVHLSYKPFIHVDNIRIHHEWQMFPH